MEAPHLIEVEPLGDGWTVRAPLFANEMPFFSGGAAERAARGLAASISRAGATVEIQIRLRDGQVAGRFLFPSLPANDVAGDRRS